MRYMGGKFRIRKRVAGFLNYIRKPEQPYWEPFVGAAWILDLVNGPGQRYASDANQYLIEMWKSVQWWEPPSTVSESEYLAIKDNPTDYPPELVAFVGFGCSWGGKWFGGYARDNTSRNYALNAKNSIMKKACKFSDVTFFAADFLETDPPEGEMLIYCDPPYSATTGYDAIDDEWDAGAFWHRVRELKAMGHTVVVSEYSAPSDFSCVLEIPTKTDMRTTNGQNPRTEKLFMPGHFSIWQPALLYHRSY